MLKVPEKKKEVSRQKSFHLFPAKTYIQVMYVLYRNKALSDTSDPESDALITNAYKPPKNVYFPEAERPFRFTWFEEFP